MKLRFKTDGQTDRRKVQVLSCVFAAKKGKKEFDKPRVPLSVRKVSQVRVNSEREEHKVVNLPRISCNITHRIDDF